MVDVLLTHCNHLYFDDKQVRKMQPYPPLQTLVAAACLRRRGFQVALFDSTLVSPEDGFREALTRHQPRLVAVIEDNFNFLTKMCLTQNRDLAFSMFGEARRAGARVVVNGSDATDRPGEYLAGGADFVLLGEVEETLLEITEHLLAGRNGTFRGIRGLAYREDGDSEVSRTPPRAPLPNLDRLPPACWDSIDIESYRRAWMDAHGYFSLNMVSSRGCPYRCNWCAKPIHGDSYRSRSPEAVAGEMLHLKGSHQPDQVWFADDLFALSSRWTTEFAAAVERLDARIPFVMQSRCDLMTRDTVEALRRAGCIEVWMGAESGSQGVLDAMDKDIRVSQIHQARENLRAHGIRACYFLQFGYPGETWEDIQATVRLVRETEPDDIGVSVSYPLPGTKFHEKVAEQLGPKQNWSDSDDLAMMFQGSYNTLFYKSLRDAIHFEVDYRNGRVAEPGASDRLDEHWRRLEQLQQTCANPRPTVLWTSC
jgi:radical SAM superfamily enzyme YgiQ (UPF0313 family)